MKLSKKENYWMLFTDSLSTIKNAPDDDPIDPDPVEPNPINPDDPPT